MRAGFDFRLVETVQPEQLDLHGCEVPECRSLAVYSLRFSMQC